MERKMIRYLVILVAVLCLLTSCTSTESSSGSFDNDTLYQTNLLQSLMLGVYEGSQTVKDLKDRGDTGIGTFDGVNGELVMVDGVVYQALGDGTVAVAADEEGIPFSTVTHFDVDDKVEVKDIADINAMKSVLDEYISSHSPNFFYMIRIEGTFDTMHVRSELKQERPYRPLDVALATDQREFKYENVEGTLVVLYCPAYMGGLNTPGYHFHFISADRTKGGHVLDFSTRSAVCSFDKTTAFEMDLTDSEDFNRMALEQEMGDAIRKVEQGK